MLHFFGDVSAALVTRLFKFFISAAAGLLAMAAVILLVSPGCGGSSINSPTESQASSSAVTASTVPGPVLNDTPDAASVVFHTDSNQTVLDVEIADTPSERAIGLMGRSHLDQDRGMIFVWDSPVQDGFWMKNTFIPLSIAFLDEDGIIIDIQDMEPQTLETHAPNQPYFYAIEVNQGYFDGKGITVGDRAQFEGN